MENEKKIKPKKKVKDAEILPPKEIKEEQEPLKIAEPEIKPIMPEEKHSAEEKPVEVVKPITEKTSNGFKTFILIVFSFIVGGMVMLALLKWTPIIKEAIGSTNGTSTNTITKSGTTVYEKSSLAASVEKIYDAVVMVQTYTDDTLVSTGSGFVYKEDSNYYYILTNHHVIESGKKVVLTLYDDSTVEAKVLGSDEYLDLAVLRINKDKKLLVATIGSSTKTSVGDTVFTIGNPMGATYKDSVTSGVLSGKDRLVTVSTTSNSSSYSSSPDWVMKVLQIDASINAGNSGGPLLNVNGEVIGICSMKLVNSSIEGMAFAIPIEYAMDNIDALEKGKKIEWPYLGVGMANVTDTATLYSNDIALDSDITEGVVVIKVVDGSAAAKSDLKKGDIITKIDNESTKSVAYLRYALYQHKAGDTVTITYTRSGKEHTTKVTLGKSSN